MTTTKAEVIQFILDTVKENEELKGIIANFGGYPKRVIVGHDGSVADATGPKRPNRKKLSEFEVKDIRAAYRGGMKQADLARAYGVNPATISRTVRYHYH